MTHRLPESATRRAGFLTGSRPERLYTPAEVESVLIERCISTIGFGALLSRHRSMAFQEVHDTMRQMGHTGVEILAVAQALNAKREQDG